MKIRFAVAPHAGSLAGAEMVGFAEALEATGFDGLWLSDLPVGRTVLRGFIDRYVDTGLSKFVVRPLGPVADWAEESAWLGDAILDLQT
jgi:hypothetical protein